MSNDTFQVESTTTTTTVITTTVKQNKAFTLSSGYVQERLGKGKGKGKDAHPLADKYGQVYQHRKVLFDAIGPGPHRCHWNRDHIVDWEANEEQGIKRLDVDHLNWQRNDNRVSNLVPSCHACNCKRKEPKANK